MSKQSILFSKSWQYYKKAEALYKKICDNEKSALSYFSLAQHQAIMLPFLTDDEIGVIEQNFLTAIKLDPNAHEPLHALGFLYQYQNQLKKAISNFTAAFIRQPQNLNYRNSLATALLLDKQYELAENGYNKILAIAPSHVDAHIGLGKLYSALAEEDVEEYFETAIKEFTTALQLSRSGMGSKKLTEKEAADLYYKRGYAIVKLNETSPAFQKTKNIYKALDDFKMASQLDPEMQSSKRAKDAIRKKLQRNIPIQLIEKVGPLIIVIMSIILFIYVQHDFWGKPDKPKLESAGYISLTFGALVFLIAGLTLPQLLKLKVAGIELEKNSIDPSTTQNTFTAGSLGLKPSERFIQNNALGTLRS